MFLVLVLILPLCHALTASIGNAKMILRPDVPAGETITIDRSILVKNVNNVSVRVNLEPDEIYEKIIEIYDNEIVLEPGEEKKANFRITLTSGGKYSGKILISFGPADPDVKENSVGLASNIIIIAGGPITEDYYKVMEPEEDEEDDIFDTNDSFDTDSEDEEETVSISIGGQKDKTKTPQTTTGPNPLVGIAIIVVFILLGLGIYFIIKKVL